MSPIELMLVTAEDGRKYYCRGNKGGAPRLTRLQVILQVGCKTLELTNINESEETMSDERLSTIW